MTRVLGADRVPAGFTITTEASVAYLRDGVPPDGLEEQVDEALGRLERAAGKRLGAPDDPLLVSVRSGARVSMPGMLDTVLNLGLGDEAVAGLAAPDLGSALRLGLATGGCCRCSAAWSAGSRRASSRARLTGRAPRPARASTPTSTPIACASSASASSGRSPTPATPSRRTPATQLREAIVAVFESWNGARARSLPAARADPRRLGDGGQRAADGLRQPRRDLGLGGGLLAQRDHRRARALGRLPDQLPGRGRGRRDPQHRGSRRIARAPARGPRGAARGARDARAPLRRHAGRRVHGRGRQALFASDPGREAPGAGLGAGSPATRSTRGCSGVPRRWRRSTPRRSRRSCTRPSTRRTSRPSSRAACPPHRGRPRARSCSRPRRRCARRMPART